MQDMMSNSLKVNKSIMNYNRNKLKTIIIALTCCVPGLLLAALDINAFKSSIITGAFYTDQNGQAGVVTPWRLVVEYNQNLDQKTDLSIRMNSQTGIETGPYIDGFNTKTEYFRIETIKYTKSLSDQLITRVGLGKLKANIIKKGGSKTPMPFSQAMARLPLKASDIAWGFQKSARNFNGAYSIGSAISNISNTTEPQNRNYSLFAEVYSATTSGSIWAQYSQNNLVQIIDSDHYISAGYDITRRNNITNATVYYALSEGFMGFDCGFKQKQIKELSDSSLGIGYGYSKDKQATLEISLEKKINKSLQATASWYIQKPEGESHYNVAGIKLTHQF